MKRFYTSRLIVLIAILSGCNWNAIAQTSSYIYTGSVQSYTVPAAATSISVDMQGAMGGASCGSGGSGIFGHGGYGGRVQCVLTVTPGEVLSLVVGGTGGNGAATTSEPGGYNNAGANGGYCSSICCYSGGGGGGCSEICIGTTALTNRVVVAGAGGGAGANWPTNYGGNGGGLTGQNGQTPSPGSEYDGTGGGQSGPGLGGTYGAYGTSSSGTSRFGGIASSFPTYSPGSAGGGGGGGYFGGGGGSWGGAGGGSSYTDPILVTAFTHTQGFNTTGNGTITIVVLCNPTGTITGTTGICAGTTSLLSNPSSITGGTWSSSNPGVATINPASGLVAGLSPGTSTITYTVNSPCGGPAALATATFTVNQTPTTILGTMALCNLTTTSLSSSPSGGTWTSSNTAQATVGSGSGTVYAVTPGTTVITYTLAGGCNVTSPPVTVNAAPVAIIGSSLVICAGQETALTITTTGGVWSSSFTGVATITAAGLVTGVNGGATLVSYALPTGCLSTASVTVNPLPIRYTITQTGGNSYCAGASSPIQIGLTGSNSGVTYQLIRSGGVTGISAAGTGSPVNFGFVSGAGRYTVLASTVAGCSDLMLGTDTITVNPGPTAYNVSGSTAFCAGGTGDSVKLSGSVSGINYTLFNGSSPVGSLSGTGSPLNFGLISTGGNYTAVAVNPATGCSATMTGSAAIVVNPMPTAYTVTGGGAYCNGTSGEHIMLSSSTVGVNYSLFRGGVFVDSIPGTGTALDFGAMTTIGSYTVVADNPVTHCSTNMTGSATISVNYPPASFTVTGGGNYCAGGTGVSIGLNGSQTTAFYQAYTGGMPEGIGPLTGIGTAFSLGSRFTVPGTYIVVATSILTGCKDTMIGSVTVGATPFPNVYVVSGGGQYCAGGTGAPVMLSNTDFGVTYQLYYGVTELGDSIVGNDDGIVSFGNVTTAGTYRVVAIDTTAGCTSNMSGTATVVVDPLPNTYSVTGTGSYCSNDAGRAVGVSLSTVGINYFLYKDGELIATVAGTGAAISFGLQTGSASYTVAAQNTVTGCSSTMSGSAIINVNPSPVAHNVTGGGSYCAGTPGTPVGLDATDGGVSYQLYNSGSPVGAAIIGSGVGTLNFGTFLAGTYTVIGTGSGCSTTMTGSATIIIEALPALFNLTGGGTVCSNSAGADIMLSNSTIGTNYQLFNGGSPIGIASGGTGAPIDFGLQTGSGGYSVVATNGAGCSANMTGTPAIIVLSSPPVHNITGGGDYCPGGVGKAVGLDSSNAGIRYQLMYGGSPVGSVLTGSGAPLNFGLYTVTGGPYDVTATNIANGCSTVMSGPVYIALYPLPDPEPVVGGGTYCIGGAGVDVSLNPSEVNVRYSLFRDGAPSGLLPMEGTGSAVDFGSQTVAGTYTIVGTDTLSGCTANMTGMAVVTISSPAIFTVLGTATYCQGAISGPVTISGSEAGVSYQLFNGPTSVGAPSVGTGAALYLGLPTGAGTYTIVGTNSTSGCFVTMAGSAVITINSLPALHNLTGGGSYCAGGTGIHLSLNGSNTGVSYQLYNGTMASGAAITGTGSSLDFGFGIASGPYSIVATNSTTSCQDIMSDTAIVIVKPTPVAFTVTAANFGNYCQGGAGADIQLSNSVTGIGYKLTSGPTTISTMAGTGSSLDFGPQRAAGTYTITATDPVAVCSNTMSGSPVVNIIPLPTLHNVNGGGGYCPGGVGQDVLVDGSDRGMYYELYISGIFTGESINGTGIVIDFGNQLAGNYMVVGIDRVIVSGDTITCADTMTGTAVVSLDTLLVPNVSIHVFPTGASIGHVDSITAQVTNAGPDPTYQWYINGNIISGATGPTYKALQFFNGDSVVCVVTSSGPCGGLPSSAYAIISLSRVGVTQVTSAGSDIKLVPNPNKGTFTLKGTTGATTDEEVSVEVVNMLGQVVYNNKVMAYAGNIDQRIQLSNTLANGMYILTLRSGTQSNFIHFVMEQ